MKVLFDLVHPADVLFFKRPIEALKARGDETILLTRHKDVTCELADAFGFTHSPISKAATGMIGAAGELALRDGRLLMHVRREKPDVMIGFGGVAIAHATALTGTPSVSFYDTEQASLQNRLTWPFISALYVPDSYTGPVPKGRTHYVPGIKELSCFHPSAFRPDLTVAQAHGLAPDRPNVFIRFVSWRANHDWGKSGWGPEATERIIAELGERARLHISSEAPLPEDLEPLRYRGALHEVHHLIGHCDLYIGESATMACESAILGVPSIFAGRDRLGYIEALAREGLVGNLSAGGCEDWLNAAQEALDRGNASHLALRDAYVASRPDWSNEILAALDGIVRQQRLAA